MENNEISRFFIINRSALLFVGDKVSKGSHAHHFIQIVITIDGPFTMDTDAGPFSFHAYVQDADSQHEILQGEGRALIVLLDPESSIGKRLKRTVLAESDCYFPDSGQFDPVLDLLAMQLPYSMENAQELLDKVLSCLQIFPDRTYGTDSRIHKVLDVIEHTEEKKIRVKDLARMVALSESRLHHLFKQEIGIPIRRFLLWKRLEDGLLCVLAQKDFTYASFEAGFSDAAHMSKTFKKMFGCTLSDIFKDSEVIQVIYR
jgi:AraC-like DNA-binding protein